MSSNLKVNTILPSTGTTIGIGTVGGLINIVGNIDVNSTSGISTFNGIDVTGVVNSTVAGGENRLKIETTSSHKETYYFLYMELYLNLTQSQVFLLMPFRYLMMLDQLHPYLELK